MPAFEYKQPEYNILITPLVQKRHDKNAITTTISQRIPYNTFFGRFGFTGGSRKSGCQGVENTIPHKNASTTSRHKRLPNRQKKAKQTNHRRRTFTNRQIRPQMPIRDATRELETSQNITICCSNATRCPKPTGPPPAIKLEHYPKLSWNTS